MKCHLLGVTWPSYPRTHSSCRGLHERTPAINSGMDERGCHRATPLTGHLVAGAGRSRFSFGSMATGGLSMLLQAVLMGLSELYKEEKEAMNVGGAGVRGGWGEWERRVGGGGCNQDTLNMCTKLSKHK